MLTKSNKVLCCFSVCCVLVLTSVCGAEPYNSDAKSAALRGLNWQEPGIHKLVDSKSTISLPKGYVATFGTEAKKFLRILGEPVDQHLEAIVINTANGDQVNFASINEGYVSITDWSDVDAAAMLEAIKNNTEGIQ